jgi:GT2 family glycosyltransferase
MVSAYLSVSIVLYNTPLAHLHKCLYSLNNYKGNILIYIVDNSLTDALKKYCPNNSNYFYIHLPNNPGFGAGHNYAIRIAQKLKCQYHLVLNADVSFDTDIISPMLDYFNEHTDIGQIMPKVFYPNGKLQRVCKLIPTPFDLFFRIILPKKIRKLFDKRFELHNSGYEQIIFVPFLSGCFMLLRHSALKKVGLFDERFFIYAEDIDLTRRIAEQYRTIFFPNVSIVHEHSTASHKSLKMLLIHMVNIYKYFNKWGWFHDPIRRKLNRKTLSQF